MSTLLDLAKQRSARAAAAEDTDVGVRPKTKPAGNKPFPKVPNANTKVYESELPAERRKRLKALGYVEE